MKMYSLPLWVSLLVAVALISVAVARIIPTYSVFNHTHDEHQHIASGMQWLVHGDANFGGLMISLPRAAVAAGPYLSGIRSFGHTDRWSEGNAILYSGDNYFHNLALARMGTLPFLIITAVLIWIWTRELWGDLAALLAVGLFTTLPIVLGHSGLATTDMAFTATLVLALYTLTRWLNRITIKWSVLLGLAIALSLFAKASTLVFFPVAGLAIFTVYLLQPGNRATLSNLGIKILAGHVLLVGLVAFASLWAIFDFSTGPITDLAPHPPPYRLIDERFGSSGFLHDLIYRILAIPLPLPEYFYRMIYLGIPALGRTSYLMGETRLASGFLLFFPVAILVKTPLPFLALACAGMGTVLAGSENRRDWRIVAPLVAAVAIVVSVLPSNINIGVRHIMPAYALISIVAGAAAASCWKLALPARIGPVLLTVLLGWQIISSVRAHPDYFAYFNELANDAPEDVLLYSDLDWGQDLKRLVDTLQEREITEVWICIKGPKDGYFRQTTKARYHELPPGEPVTGWVAISVACLKQGDRTPPFDQFSWLQAYTPIDTVGRTIKLYQIPGTNERHAPRQEP